MAKKNFVTQLDLFGTTDAMQEIKPASSITYYPELENNNFIFLDEKIGVKLKPKVTPNIAATQSNQTTDTTTETIKSKRGRKSFKDMDAEIDLVEIPSDEILQKKLYYPIREVAAFFKCNTSLIRAWELEFDILQPRKNRKGDRLFRIEDIKNLQTIHYLLRKKKLSVEGAKDYLKSNKNKADAQQQLTQSLNNLKNFLLEIKANLD